jgi:5-methylcytosine-specific restriction protein B
MAELRVNRFLKYFAPLLDALRSTDPTPMRPAAALAWIRANVDVAADDLTRTVAHGKKLIFEDDVSWARFYLSVKRGLWGLTPEGRTTHLSAESTREILWTQKKTERIGSWVRQTSKCTGSCAKESGRTDMTISFRISSAG